MPRIKVPRKSTAIDMTAMCDVAFLLLTFFILTAKPKAEDPVQVDTPASTVEVLVPEADVAYITVGGKGKVFFGVEGNEVRKELLKQMGAKYNIGFTETELKAYSNMNTMGVPMGQVKQFLAIEPEQRSQYKQPGISDTTELYNWIYQARVVTKNLHDKDMRVTIKGDSKEEYPTMQRIIATLQKQKVNKFSLITSLRAK